jgi:hypothetical protein
MSYTDSELGRLVSSYESTRDRYWLTRHYLSAATLLAMVAVALSPGTLYGRALAATGPIAWVLLAALMLVSAAALWEAFVTAFVPRWSCDWLRKRRHIVFMIMALGQLCLAFPVAIYALDGALLLVLNFALNATVATAIAFLDLFARHSGGTYE